MIFIRYEDAPTETVAVVDEVRGEFFPELVNVNIKIIYDLKARKSRGNLVLGRIQKTNELNRLLTRNETINEEGYDFFLYLDKMVFTHVEKKDKVRIVRHQLRHIYIDPESVKNPYKLTVPDIRDFSIEMKLNKDDERWAERVMEVAMSLYETEKESNKPAFSMS
ncbi:MAG: hypothetical protein HQK99_00475 [Nitrospirae bacterium]|nr:hypothetical protein [Nitrospirota bacterium]